MWIFLKYFFSPSNGILQPVSHFHLVRRWIHVNDRCKNFISFYNRSRIKLSSRGKDNMSQHFQLANSPSISEFSANEKWLWTRITSFGEHFSKDFPFSTQKRLRAVLQNVEIILFVFVLRKTIWSSKERKHKVETFEQSAKHFTTNNHFSDKIKDQMLMFPLDNSWIIARDFNFK